MIGGVQQYLAVEGRPGAVSARAVLLSLSVALLAGACAPVGGPTPGSVPSGPPFPPIEAGGVSRSGAREAAALLAAARDSLAAGAFQVARGTAERVVREYPGAPGSGEALQIAARALMSLDRPQEAADAALLLVNLLPANHPGLPPMCLLAARGYSDAGQAERAVDALRHLPTDPPDSVLVPARDLLRAVIPQLEGPALEAAAAGFPDANPLRGILATEWAGTLYQRGEVAEATRWAGIALSGSLESREREMAQGILDGHLEEVLGIPVVLGAILPLSDASPGLLQYGEWIREGIEVALEEFSGRVPRPVELEVQDDRGSPLGGERAVQALEDAGAMGALGPLTQEVLQETATARRELLPIVSPFSYLPPDEAPGVFSLSGPDPGGARLVARMARELGLATVAVVRPETEEARVDAQAFREEYESLGGIVPREIVFDSGGTFFQPQFQVVEAILPDGLFLPLTPEDIQLLAPQVTFYGLDTLGIQLLGTSGWTEESVVQGVDSRHTDGVVASTVRLTQDETEAFQRFRNAYESLFQKSLRSQVPAFGYDAAALFLTALETGPRNPGELLSALEEVKNLEGATGNLSVDRGWVTREPLLVRIQDHELIYIGRRF
jgi:ABC-type branched-subunit amino acid transport system substrate-binding protein